MQTHSLLVLLALTVLPCGVSAQTTRPALPLSAQAEQIQRKIDEVQSRMRADQAALERLQAELAATEMQAKEELVKQGRAGDEKAIGTVLDLMSTSSEFVEYDYGKIARIENIKPLLQAVEERWASGSPIVRCKYVWLLGVNGSQAAAARLRRVLEQETSPDVLGNALFALSRCSPSPENVAGILRFAGDERLITNSFGFYPHGWYGADAEGGKNYTHQPLGTLAKELAARHDRENSATIAGELIVEPATIHCAGFVWEISGDANRNCTVQVAYRLQSAKSWRQGPPLLRCESWPSPDPKYRFEIGEKLAGSIFDLAPDTTYEVRLTLSDPDGGSAERLVTTRTIQEPEIYAGLRTLYVVPGNGGGSGTKAEPLMGIAAADAAAQPGDVLLLQAGTYLGSVGLKKSGEAGKPIVWRGVDVERVILDGTGKDESLSFSRQSHLHFENISFTGAKQGCIKTYGSQDIVVRRCKFFRFNNGLGIIGQGDSKSGRNSKNWFVIDNEIKANKAWTKDRGSAALTGVSLSGERNIIAYNKITDCWDCISLSGSRDTQPVTSSTDVYANDLWQAADDGVEADYTYHNVRIFRNRLTNTFSSLSAQPTFGGPTYFLYNAMYNTTNKPFKLHVNSTGIIAAHNTAAVSREAFYGGTFHQAILRNNLLLGLPGGQGYWMSTQGFPLDMDYGGYNIAAPSRPLLNINQVRYRTMQDATDDLGIMKHGVLLDWDVFTNAKQPPGDDQFADKDAMDLSLRPQSKAVDAGIVLPGINDGYTGRAPDLGCYEVGKPIPHYGPRL